MTSLKNKDSEFWKRLEDLDVFVLSETWVDRKEGEQVREKMPKGYVWEV